MTGDEVLTILEIRRLVGIRTRYENQVAFKDRPILKRSMPSWEVAIYFLGVWGAGYFMGVVL